MRAILKHGYLFTTVLIVAGFFCVQAQANEQPENETLQAPHSSTLRGYHQFDYKFDERPDPFLPIFSKKEPQKPQESEGKKKIDPNEVLTGLQKFEPGQLKLVAVMSFQDKNVAMLEDVTGAGHLVEQGTAIGRHGIVSNIDANSIMVTETYETTRGNKVVNEIPIRMQ